MTKYLIENLYFEIWNKGNFDLLPSIVHENYIIHSDPGDLWEGKGLNYDEYKERVLYSRMAFPDLEFELHDIIHEGKLFAVRWSAKGTQLGDLNQLPATGKVLAFNGQTFYETKNERVSGHWQMIDRLGFFQQLQNND